MVTTSEMYSDYPILVNSDDFEKYLGIELGNEIVGTANTRISAFLDTIHRHIYDFLIYNIGEKDIKERLVEEYRERLKKPLKKALLTQGQYLLQNDNIELFNGVVKTVNGVDYKETSDTVSRIICPSVINILEGSSPNILFAGE